jgi:transposase
VDLLSDRSAETLARWLQDHPGVEIISRDRANDYIEGASRGAPDAIQVADRFHLLQNVREMLQRLLERHQAALRAATAEDELVERPDAASAAGSSTVGEGDIQMSPASETATDLTQAQPPPAVSLLSKAENQKQARQAARRHRYETVRTLHGNGVSQRQIARQLRMSVHTVRCYLRADQFPQRATRQVSSKLDPFLPYLRQQLEAGHDNAMQLWRDLRDQFGYTGSRPLVSRWVARHRHLCPQPSVDQPKQKRPGRPPGPPRPQPTPVRHLSARQAAWLLVRRPEELDEEEGSLVERLCQHAAQVQVAYVLAQAFIQMVRQRSVASFEEWLIQVEASGIPELQGFAAGLQRDKQAVMAALSLPYSNGQVEGQINRLKFIKRSMYGRAGFDLLRKRVLAA